MLPQRLHWLLPVLIVSWTVPLQLGAALPAHDERDSHVSTNANPSVSTPTMTRQDYNNKRVQSPDGKNSTQSGHKLVASPAGLLRPDKFQFYTYNDKGDMITRQMTVQEIQGLIAAGGVDHITMDKQEIQKADDVLTGGKKVMDVVQKVQNVLKSALDKPSTLTGSMPKIPEHANVEWSNILPSILSGETDAISSSVESNHSLHKLTTERVEAGSGTVEHPSSTASASNVGTSATTMSNEKRPTIQSNVQTNAYAGFANNTEDDEKSQHAFHRPQQDPPQAFTEKPMIPVPVITLTEQKLSTLQSAVTESPIFQMLSVIPVETYNQSAYNKDDHRAPAISGAHTTEVSAQIENSFDQTGHFVEVTLSEAPEVSTVSQSTSLSAYLTNTATQTDVSFAVDKASQQTGIPTIAHSTTAPSVSTVSSAVDADQVVTYGDATNTIGEIASSNYIPIQNNTSSPEDSPFVSGVTKEPRVNGTYNNDEIISRVDATTTSRPISHASAAPWPAAASNETTLRSPSTFSRIETTTVTTTPPHTTDRPGDDPSPTAGELTIGSATPTYAQHHVDPRPIEVQATAPMEPSLSTQLIDSFSNVMNQISEAKPAVLFLSSTPVGTPEMSVADVNADYTAGTTTVAVVDAQRDTLAPDSANEENVERVVGAQTYATVATRPPSQNVVTTRTTVYSAPVSATASSLNASSLKETPAKPTSTSIGATGDRITADSPIATSSRPNVEATDAIISGSTTSSPASSQFEKIHGASPVNKFVATTTPEIAAVTAAALEKYTREGTASPETSVSSVASTVVETATTRSTSASIGTSGSSSGPITINTPINDPDNTLVKLNWSNPVSAIDQILNTVPLPSETPSIGLISLPSDTTNFSASGLASGLIAGFATSAPEKPSSYEDSSENQIAKNASSAHTTRPIALSDVTKPAVAVKNVTQIHKGATELNGDQQKKGSVTYVQTSTQKPHPMDSTEELALQSSTQAGKANDTCSIGVDKDGLTHNAGGVTDVKSVECESGVTSSGENASTNEPIKSSNSNERVDDSTDGPSLSSLPSKFDEPMESSEQSAVTATVSTKPEELSTTGVIEATDKTLLDTSQKRKEDNIGKTKTTEASVVRTDVSPESPMKIALSNAANESENAASSAKTETSGERNDSLANVPMQKVTAGQEQHQGAAGHAAGAVGDSDSTLHSSSEHPNNDSATTVVDASHIGLDTSTTSSDGNLTDAAFSQDTRRVSNATSTDKNEEDGNATITPITPSVVTVTSRAPVQNDQNADSIGSPSSFSPSLSTQDQGGSVVQIVTPANAGGNKGTLPRPNVTDDFSNQNNKNAPSYTAQIMPMSDATNAESLAENATMQSSAQSNRTEDKPASSKYSENPAKPEAIRPSNAPVRQSATKPTSGGNHKFSEKPDVTKSDVNINTEDKWTLIAPQTPPSMTKLSKPSKPPRKPIGQGSYGPDEGANVRLPETSTYHQQDEQSQQPVLPLDASQSASGLDATVKHTSADIVNFAKLCNELAFNFWVATNKGLSTARSLALSPFGMTSLLAMIFLGARGPTSDQMNEVLGLDDVATFNPHLVFQNITDTVSLTRGQGIANAAFVRELFADKMKVRKLMPFYKEQAQQFYEGLVAEVNFATISDLVRRRTNLLIRKQTGGRIKDFVKTNTVPLRSPLAALSANVFQTDCNTTLTSSVGRDGELYFAVSPAVRQRRLVPVPATTWRSGVLAGYEPSIDATAVALGGSDRLVSTIFVLPGQQGHTAPGDTLDRLEQRLVRSAFRDGTWNKLLKILIPRNGLELQVPKFSHRSVINATAALKRMGLDELFSSNADLKGINGIGHRLHLADVLQMNLFSTCGDENILSGRHHVETYPASPLRSIRRRIEDTSDNPGDVNDDDTPRQNGASSRENRSRSTDRHYREKRQLSTISEKPRLKLDRPFLYFVRHNPSGIILHMGRFNPRLLP